MTRDEMLSKAGVVLMYAAPVLAGMAGRTNQSLPEILWVPWLGLFVIMLWVAAVTSGRGRPSLRDVPGALGSSFAAALIGSLAGIMVLVFAQEILSPDWRLSPVWSWLAVLGAGACLWSGRRAALRDAERAETCARAVREVWDDEEPELWVPLDREGPEDERRWLWVDGREARVRRLGDE